MFRRNLCHRGSPPLRRLTPLAVFLSTLSIAASAHAADYYVSTSGNDSNPGTQGSPFKTIQKGADVAHAGDTVHVLPGTYNEWIQNKNNGTATARIRFVSDTRWGAKVTGANSSYAWMDLGAYVDIEGFDVTGSSRALVGIGLLAPYSRALYNHVHDIISSNCAAGGGGIVTGEGDLKKEGEEVIGNLIHDIGAFSPSLPYCNHVHGIYMAAEKAVVQNNIVYHAGSAGIHLWHAATNSVVSNNLSFNNRGPGIIFGCGDKPFIKCDNIMISNNIAMNNEGYGIREYGDTGSGDRVMNNILYNNKGGDTPTMISGTASGNFTGVNPGLANLAGGDYHLAAGSKAIDAGTTACVPNHASCAPTEDFWQGARPFGNGYDIGPHESGSTPGSAPPLIPPTGSIGGILPGGGGSGAGGKGSGWGGISNCAR
ncbi:MAG: DUF1565 domain-containing protein [Candidatus Saccharimonadales bacterium]